MYYKVDSTLNPIQIIVDPSLIKQGTTMYIEPLYFSTANPWLTYDNTTMPPTETIPNYIIVECDEIVNCLLANGTGTAYFWNIDPTISFYANQTYTRYTRQSTAAERYKLSPNLGVLNMRFIDQYSNLVHFDLQTMGGVPVSPTPVPYTFSFRIIICSN